jgi:hypothetical protein
MGFAVGDEADVGAGQGGLVEVIDEGGDDALAEAALLMLRVDGDVDDLEEEAAIADDAAHADGFAVFTAKIVLGSPADAASALFGLRPAAMRRRR